MKPGSTRPLPRLIFAMVGAVLVGVAFQRGNHLLGLDFGVLYAAIAGGLLCLLAQSLMVEKPLAGRIAAGVILSTPVCWVMAFPASINPDIQHFINKQATDRAARAELSGVFESDPAFRGLSVSTIHVKVVNVTIHGSLDDRADLDRLRQRIDGECPTVRLCPLHWDVLLRQPGERVDGLDSELFGARERLKA